MKKFLFASAIILGMGLMALRADAAVRHPSPPCDFFVDSYCTGSGGNCAPTDECCKCKAPCISQYINDVQSCGLTGPAATDCVAEALKKETDCLNLCTVDNKCQDA